MYIQKVLSGRVKQSVPRKAFDDQEEDASLQVLKALFIDQGTFDMRFVDPQTAGIRM